MAISRKEAVEGLQAARIAIWPRQAFNQLTMLCDAREVAMAAGLNLEEIAQLEYDADVRALGEARARSLREKQELDARYAELARKIAEQKVRSQKGIRPLLQKLERAGGKLMDFGGDRFVGTVNLDNATFRSILEKLEALVLND